MCRRWLLPGVVGNDPDGDHPSMHVFSFTHTDTRASRVTMGLFQSQIRLTHACWMTCIAGCHAQEVDGLSLRL